MSLRTLYKITVKICALVGLVTTTTLLPNTVVAHDNNEHCEAIAASVNDAGFSDKVSVSCSANQALISLDTYPVHELMTGIVGTNDSV